MSVLAFVLGFGCAGEPLAEPLVVAEPPPAAGVVSPAAAPPAAPPPTFQTSARPLTPEERAVMTPLVWREGCPVPLDQLRRVTLSYWRPDGASVEGALVVADTAVESISRAFETLWQLGFPVERMEPIEAFRGDDNASMAANNTSAFNCRDTLDAPGQWSRHSYGTAVDINPLWNPWVRGGKVAPETGRRWADRSRREPGMFHAGQPAVRAFLDVGWGWGGAWTTLVDSQHFSSDGR